jgi:diaminohydroxyphosphoribosylaminopyrimidine deaminase/5-amino-6-(5-phosphoribosylamino)uracil reductase
MARAVELSIQGPEYGPNPRVGCVIVDAHGAVVGEGFHRGAGTPHAEVEAIADAARRGISTRGATVYVTLEPCRHVGRTGPCVNALSEAGVARVVYAVSDPGEASGGGADVLRERGVEAILEPTPAAEEVNARFLHALKTGRPYVILKFACTLDGRTAAADGTSFWITGEEARNHAHRERGSVDAIIVGTGTVVTDDPELSARPGGIEGGHQPLRVVMGTRETSGRKIWRDDNAMQCWTHDPRVVLDALQEREVRSVIVEGGATVSSAFLRSGLVDEVHAYLAPVLLGAGRGVVTGLGIRSIGEALRLDDVRTVSLGPDTLVTGRLQPRG